MLIQRTSAIVHRLLVFSLFLVSANGFSQNITFTYGLVGSAALSTYSDGKPYTTSTVNSKQLVQLKGKVPASGERIMLFSFLQVRDAAGEFICQVDKSKVLAPYAMAGIMARQSIEPGKNYSLLGISGNNYIVYEQCINGVTSCMATATLPAGTSTFYIKAVVQGGLVKYYVAPQLYANISDWLILGQTISIPNNTLVGPFLVPGSRTSYDIAKFTDLHNNLNGAIVTGGLGKVAATSNNLDALLADLVKNHASRMAADPTYAKLFNQLKDYHDKATELTIASTDSEVTKISKASCNAELYIVDIVYHSIIAGPGGTPVFSYSPSQYKLYYNLRVLEFMHIVQSAASTCDEALAPTLGWKDGAISAACAVGSVAGLLLGPWAMAGIYAGCVVAAEAAYRGGLLLQCNDAKNYATAAKATYQPDLDTRDRILLHSADYITNLAILCSLSKTYRDSYLGAALQFSGQLKEMMVFAHALYQDNNIPIRAYSAIAFLELVWGTKNTLAQQLNPMLDSKFVATGGYGEGTAYLNEVHSDLIPLYYFGRKAGWLAQSELKQSVLNSGRWLLSISDAGSGSVPAVDDAYEITPWLAPFCYLNNDTRYLDYTNKYFTPIMGYALPGANDYFTAGVSRRFLTYPASMFTPTPTPVANPDVSFNDGVGKIHFREGSADVNVCLIAEDGQVLTSGNSHDQQDNGSLTLNRTTGPGQIDRLVMDPGYAGFSRRHETSYYQLHNTVLINGGGVNSNAQWQDGDIKTMVKNAFNISSQTVIDGLFDQVKNALLGSSPAALDKSAGTASASLSQPYSNGLSVYQYFDVPSVAGVDNMNFRNVITYDGEVIVVDNIHSRQNNYGLHWNLPPTTAKVGTNTLLGSTGATGNSQIRVSIFSQDQNNMAVSLAPATYASEISAGVNVASVTASNSGTGPLYNNDYFNYLTVIETKDNSANLTGAPAYSSVPGTSPAVCITKAIPSTGITRYIFVNNILNGKQSTIAINGVSTDAGFGIMDFRTGTTALVNVLVYGYSSLVNNGTPITPPTTQNAPEFKLRTVLSNQIINGNTTVTATNAVNISNVTLNPPAALKVTGSQRVVIFPQTRITNGSTAVVKVTP